MSRAVAAILTAALGVSSCTTLRSPSPPGPGARPVVYGISADTALEAIRESLADEPGVEAVVVASEVPSLQFDYAGFRGIVKLVCLAGPGGEAGWWPAVAMSGASFVLAPRRLARLVAFYARLPGHATDALAAVADGHRIARPREVPRDRCGA